MVGRRRPADPASLPRTRAPTPPLSSASTGPAHAPTMTQIAAPENQDTRASATPKKPYWVSLRVTTAGIQTLAANA